MALSTATELKTAVQDWLDRSDYSAVADDMILLAEGHFNLELRCREMETISDLTPSSGVCTLPTDFLGPIRVVVKTSPRCILTYIGPSIVDKKHDASVSGIPVDYTIIGESLYTYPLSSTDIELTYWQKIPPLASNASNWLLAHYPNLYLEACMMEAHRYFRNTQELAISSQRVIAMIDRLSNNSFIEHLADATMTNWDITP